MVRRASGLWNANSFWWPSKLAETAGSGFVQSISLAAGDAGKRVEFSNVIDWNTRESNLKAVFPLTASNEMATYNWDIGTIERRTAEPKKFEVPSPSAGST